ncbi:hypothetical protein F4803DRAFT_573624 [Xylaria telfairii]|nr:hypothetical protein F4803DRAFT_573624 [Xylaria telfairii]
MDIVPFAVDVELIGKLTDCDIPNGTADRLDIELSCPSNDHIDPIHQHLQKGRKIVLPKDPNLHLIWNRGIVYIKPLPYYLLSDSFWQKNLAPGSENRGKALGFMRSYERLIRHPSDFELAREARLIPSSSSPSPPSLTFIRYFSGLANDDVSDRWYFGQIRLSRLNWAVRIFQPKPSTQKGFLHRLFYEEQFWQMGQFVNESVAPLLFVFAALWLILSAMQIVLTAKSGDGEGS